MNAQVNEAVEIIALLKMYSEYEPWSGEKTYFSESFFVSYRFVSYRFVSYQFVSYRRIGRSRRQGFFYRKKNRGSIFFGVDRLGFLTV